MKIPSTNTHVEFSNPDENLDQVLATASPASNAEATKANRTQPVSTLPNSVFLGVKNSGGIFSYLSKNEIQKLSEVSTDFHQLSRTANGFQVRNRADLAKVVEYMAKWNRVENDSFQGMITLDQHGQFTDEDLRLLASVPSLRKVNLKKCDQITDEGLAHLKNAIEVNLSWCDQITDAGLKHLKNATQVNLSWCRKITNAGLVHLSNATHVNMEGCRKITDEGLVHLKNATQVNLSWCRQITNIGLKQLTNATHANLTECPQITAEGIQYLTNKHVNVTDR